MSSDKVNVNNIPEEEYILPGTRACAGCSLSIAYRFALKALGKNTIVTVPASCSTVLHGMYPVSAVRIPMLNTAFETTGASASGIRAALNVLGKKNITVLGWAGDGGTADIGIQALSGAAERNTDMIYACYDNEFYSNTGGQRSSSTPFGAFTTTTPKGKRKRRKNMPAIMAAHGIPYVATASSSFPLDLYEKFKKAKEQYKGDTRYIHIQAPCAPGHGFDTSKTIKIGRLAVETGIWTLYEIINGKFILSPESEKIVSNKKKRKPVSEYYKTQKRFRFMTDEDIRQVQKDIDLLYEDYKKFL
ncbi:MAG: pyruvate synthase subunit beta [Candidatus Lokiarchaeota archaeon]|nr:pyruvate synthase subunit beta [Candidatus Lokiarchaeota archaeon]